MARGNATVTQTAGCPARPTLHRLVVVSGGAVAVRPRWRFRMANARSLCPCLLTADRWAQAE
jgi:hypothetical protein